MFSYLISEAAEKVASLLTKVCPCLDPLNKKSHDIGDLHRTSKRQPSWGVDLEAGDPDGKIFTIETMKRIAVRKMTEKDAEMSDKNDSFTLERCPWNTESSDMLLKVGRSIFPVHRFLLSIESEILKTIIDSIPATQNRTTVVTLNGYDADEIQMLLTFVYLPESEIDGKLSNISRLLFPVMLVGHWKMMLL